MGRIADSLRANLREVAKSDARSLKEMDEELRSATNFSKTSKVHVNVETIRVFIFNQQAQFHKRYLCSY